MSEKVAIVIPARYASSRLPGKPLADIDGKPMIQHVYERASQVGGIDVVVVATDDERVKAVVDAFGGRCLMTSSNHASGTDRLVEVMHQLDADIYINLQGDEPMVRPSDVEKLVDAMLRNGVPVATLCHRIPASESSNPNTVKVVRDHEGNALYFSRAAIPFPRDGGDVAYFKHVGIYGYRRAVLAGYSQLAESSLEQIEKLEQLRLLSAGLRIRTIEVEPTGPGVDTPECLELVRALMAGKAPAAKPVLANIKLVITDVDGVLTDGGIYYDESGECLKRFHVRDGLGIRMLEENGIRVAVVSGRDSATLRKRVTDLGVSNFSFGVKDKAAACRALMEVCGVTANETACIGDDTIDLPAFDVCGLSYAVADAPRYVKQRATSALTAPGGSGAFRELADAILLAQGKEEVFSSAKGFLQSVERATQ